MAKPIVDGLERQLGADVQVIRLNVLQRNNRNVLAEYGVRVMPTLLVLDGCGNVVERQVGIVRPAAVLTAAHDATCRAECRNTVTIPGICYVVLRFP